MKFSDTIAYEQLMYDQFMQRRHMAEELRADEVAKENKEQQETHVERVLRLQETLKREPIL